MAERRKSKDSCQLFGPMSDELLADTSIASLDSRSLRNITNPSVSGQRQKLDMKSIYCLVLFFAIALALPHQQPIRNDGRDAAADTDKPKDSRQPSSLPSQENANQIKNDHLHRSLINQSSPATTNGQPLNMVTTPPSTYDITTSYSELLSDNSTLLIDYNQQTYISSSEAPATSAESLLDMNGTLSEPRKLSLANSKSIIEGDSDEFEVKSSSTGKSSELIGEMRAKPEVSSQVRDMRDARSGDKLTLNMSEVLTTLFKKKPYSKYWSVEQKWDDIFRRFMSIQGTVKSMMLKNFLRDIEYYADVSISQKCADDLKFIQNYTAKSTNMRWLAHMFDSTGKSESGMLTGNLAHLGHVVQCIKVRAPSRHSNETFDERYFDLQAAKLGERFRGKYCLASLRPVMPEKPRLVSRFSEIFNPDLMSNISYMGLRVSALKERAVETSVPEHVYESIDRHHYRLDQIPFESELFQYLIEARNFGYSLPRFMGVCYPSSCSKDDIRYSIQKSVDDQHQVVDIEFECEVEEKDAWEFFTTPRLVVYLLLTLVVSISAGATFTRHILVDRLKLKERLNLTGNSSDDSKKDGRIASLIAALDKLSMDKCAGILFIKTRPASPIIDKDKMENTRSTSIDALKGFLVMILIYSELIHLGCLPVPFMWSKWSDAMFPFFRSYATQIFLNASIWSEAFYIISAYLISLKFLENNRHSSSSIDGTKRLPRLSSFIIKRYIRLLLPMLCFILFGYVWPRLSNGFVLQDQAGKILAPCDNHGWTNLLMFHNHYAMNETCLWPSHVSASFFQLHLLSYPILVLLLLSLRSSADMQGSSAKKISGRLVKKLLSGAGLGIAMLLAFIGIVYSASRASSEDLIVPFLIDYIDYDNYRRVIEWTVMPTHNHLASYMVGILLAYKVVGKRVAALDDTQSNQAEDWETCMQREGSLDSVVSSSTQELNLKPAFMFKRQEANKINRHLAPISSASSRATSSMSQQMGQRSNVRRCISQLFLELVLIVMMLVSLTSSYYWNGLGQPMSSIQTFWYMIGTKVCFLCAFACFFYRHFALRRNSSNPWMITRFLVPIGRMSLMLFYVSWPVIWFDLLASLYQWHPSHYFIFEKYNEIIFMTLIISMLAYGAFEGTVKMIQYQRRSERRRIGEGYGRKVARDGELMVAGFENLFQPIDWDDNHQLPSGRVELAGKSLAATTATQDLSSLRAGSEGACAEHNKMATYQLQVTGLSAPTAHQYKTKGSPPATGSSATGRKRLSVADQYKLNAELRANYSFASIGLYESAGATDDLPSSNRQSGGDLQVSPGPADKQRHK